VKINALCPGFTRTEFHERGRMKMKGLPEFMWLDSDQLVARSWSDAQSGKAVSVPGWQYKLLVGFTSILPRAMVRSIGMNLRKR
jgi:short-subunit dehydrogenase